MVEGAPLLRAYMHKMRIEGSNPSLSAKTKTGRWPVFVLAKSESTSRTFRFDQRRPGDAAQDIGAYKRPDGPETQRVEGCTYRPQAISAQSLPTSPSTIIERPQWSLYHWLKPGASSARPSAHSDELR